MRKYVAIVDPYFSGALLAERFRARGYKCIAIHSRPLEGKAAASFRHSDFVASIVHEGEIASLVKALEVYPLAVLLAAVEAGVLLADELAAHFKVQGNHPTRSLARRDKYIMHQQIAAQGLRAMDQIRAREFEELAAWCRRRDRWPVVVKPPLSGATDGVRICDTAAEAEEAFLESINRVNALGFRNETMIAQEYIDGTEFVVDAVTCKGRHQVVSVAYYRKERGTAGGPIYREMFFIPPEDWPLHADVVSYAKDVLDALGVTYGPSHTEIFLDESGPVLVESGARLCGAMVPRYLEAVAKISPLELVVSSYVDSAAFDAAIAKPQRHSAHLHAYFLRNSRGGRVAAHPGDDLLRTLPTFKDVLWYAARGADVASTRDLWSALGLVFLISPDRSAINADVARIEQWERDDMLVTLEG